MTDIEALRLRLGTGIDYQQFELDALAPLKIASPPPPAAEPARSTQPAAPTPALTLAQAAAPAAGGFGRYGERTAVSSGETLLVDLFRRLERHAR